MTLKIIHLSTWDIEGGAARAAYRQHKALLQAGVDSQMLVRFKNSNNDDTVRVFRPSSKILDRVKRVTSRYYFSYWRNRNNKRVVNPTMTGILTDPRSEILRKPNDILLEADIINLHKVQDFVDIFSLFNTLPRSIPIVVTLHDLGYLTGGCDYPCKCQRFEHSCGQCPAIVSNDDNDSSAKIYSWKKQAYQQRIRERLVFVANSHWTYNESCRSSLLSAYPCQTIHYGIDSTIYNSKKRHVAREALGLPQDQPVLLFAAHNVSHYRKGGNYIVEVLQGLHGRHNPMIVTFGDGGFPVGNYQSLHFDRVDNDRLQSLIYQAADVFIMPSLEEAFGQTALEAVACGTVVAGFSAGGIPDIVVNGLNGILVSPGDTKALLNAILGLLDNRSLRQNWLKQSAVWVDERFSYKVNADKYINLYSQLLEKP